MRLSDRLRGRHVRQPRFAPADPQALNNGTLWGGLAAALAMGLQGYEAAGSPADDAAAGIDPARPRAPRRRPDWPGRR